MNKGEQKGDELVQIKRRTEKVLTKKCWHTWVKGDGADSNVDIPKGSADGAAVVDADPKEVEKGLVGEAAATLLSWK